MRSAAMAMKMDESVFIEEQAASYTWGGIVVEKLRSGSHGLSSNAEP